MAEPSGDLRRPTPDIAVRAYEALPDERRNIPELNVQLAKLGYSAVSKSTFHRWRADLAHMPPPKVAPPVIVERAALSGIPEQFVEALGLRMLAVAKGDELDKLERIIVKVAEAIGGKADAIAAQLLEAERETESVETVEGAKVSSKKTEAANVAKNAVGALVMLTEAMHKITAARTLYSVAHRNFAESDRLSGEGDKFKAEAETLRNAAAADNAKVINQPGSDHGYDEAGDDDAIAGLRQQ